MSAILSSPWSPLRPDALPALLGPLDAPWWLAGGCALDAFVGCATRAHDDLDVLILRRDAEPVRARLAGWDLHAASGGALRSWATGTRLRDDDTSIWCRPRVAAPWALELLLGDADGARWVYRRDARITRPLATLGLTTRAGMPVLAPEVQLLFKARDLRAKDTADFEAVLPALDAARRAWLRDALALAHPSHAWRHRL